jgi:hypothetical protein
VRICVFIVNVLRKIIVRRLYIHILLLLLLLTMIPWTYVGTVMSVIIF